MSIPCHTARCVARCANGESRQVSPSVASPRSSRNRRVSPINVKSEIAASIVAIGLLLLSFSGTARAVPAKAPASRPAHPTEVATFSGGCFWSMNAIFERLKGVESVTAGFSGGSVVKPSYPQVCTGTTGHAETVEITFDPAVISYSKLLEVFFASHDPTTPNRQGADEGTQYRSAIFWHSPEQKAAIAQEVAALTSKHAYNAPIVTQILPYAKFFSAEPYHQAYYDKHPSLPYNMFVIAPKLAKLHAHFPELIKPGM